MRVAVEHAVDDDLLEISREQVLGDRRGVERSEFLARYFREVPAAHETQRQHPPRGILGVDGRGRQALKIGDLPTDGASILGLLAKVEFLAQAVLEFAHHLWYAIARAVGRILRQEARDFVQHLDIDLDSLAYARPLDLHDDLVAVAEGGAVNLSHRGCSQRLWIERLKQISDRRAEFGLDNLNDLIARHGNDGAL